MKITYPILPCEYNNSMIPNTAIGWRDLYVRLKTKVDASIWTQGHNPPGEQSRAASNRWEPSPSSSLVRQRVKGLSTEVSKANTSHINSRHQYSVCTYSPAENDSPWYLIHPFSDKRTTREVKSHLVRSQCPVMTVHRCRGGQVHGQSNVSLKQSNPREET